MRKTVPLSCWGSVVRGGTGGGRTNSKLLCLLCSGTVVGPPQEPTDSGSGCFRLSDKYRGSAIWPTASADPSRSKLKTFSAGLFFPICSGVCEVASFIPRRV